MATTALGCSQGGPDNRSGQDSSVQKFCVAVEGFRDSVDAADSADIAAYVRVLKAAAAEVAQIGVPDDIPPEAEQGFDLTIERIENLADDATQEDVAQLGDVSDEDQRKLDALKGYIEKACPGATQTPS